MQNTIQGDLFMQEKSNKPVASMQSEPKANYPRSAATRDEIDTSENRHRLQAVLYNHVGKANAISMTALYEIVFDRPWNDKINDTRALRHLITAMRDDGIAIGSTSSQNGGGYYIPAEGKEFLDYLKKREIKALVILKQNSQAKKVSLPAYLGQLQLEHLGETI